jgi:hypothetical protein
MGGWPGAPQCAVGENGGNFGGVQSWRKPKKPMFVANAAHTA